jgi:hypothetical protein
MGVVYQHRARALSLLRGSLSTLSRPANLHQFADPHSADATTRNPLSSPLSGRPQPQLQLSQPTGSSRPRNLAQCSRLPRPLRTVGKLEENQRRPTAMLVHHSPILQVVAEMKTSGAAVHGCCRGTCIPAASSLPSLLQQAQPVSAMPPITTCLPAIFAGSGWADRRLQVPAQMQRGCSSPQEGV